MYETEMQTVCLPASLRLHNRWLENANAWGKFLARHQLPAQPAEAATRFKSSEEIYRSVAQRKGAIYGGEKSPTLTTHLERLQHRFPDCKIITIIRHPADVYASVLDAGKEAPWFSKRGWLERQLFSQETMLQSAFKLRQKGHRLLHITYDELSNDTEPTCKRICDYLELPFAKRMCSLEGSDLSAVFIANHHFKLHIGKIFPTQRNRDAIPDKLLPLLEEMWKRWSLMHAALTTGCDCEAFSAQLPSHAVCLLRIGRMIIFMRTIKRAIYHLMPSESIRFLRAVKIMLWEMKELQHEFCTPRQLFLNRVYALLISAVLLSLGSMLMVLSRGTLSPLLFFFFTPMVVGWLSGDVATLVAAAATAIVMTVCLSDFPYSSFSEP